MDLDLDSDDWDFDTKDLIRYAQQLRTNNNTLKVMVEAYHIANEFDCIPMEDEYIERVREVYGDNPNLETILSKYSGYSHSDMISTMMNFIEKEF